MLLLIPEARKDKSSREVTPVGPWLFHTQSEPFPDGKFLELDPQSAFCLQDTRLNSKDFG